ncbi:MAG: YifB family Mg chelatase-like AAA ATPase [Desulfobulbus sp.]|jgi:magnesium chelatase family protein
MLATVTSCAVAGVDGLPVQVEVDLAQGLPAFSTVGLAEGAVREAKDRVRAAIKNAGYTFPQHRITVNLAPAALKKEGTAYDLPIAVGILAAAGLLAPEALDGFAMVGELSLDGSLRPVPGILPMALSLRQSGIRRFLVPADNAKEAAMVREVEIYGIERLDQAVELLAGKLTLVPVQSDPATLFARQDRHEVDFAEVRGQEHVKRAVEIAAAGGHNLLLCGVPGTGKTMIARRVPTILPALSLEEALETTAVFSIAGLLPQDCPLVVSRPFRSPHHTVSDAGLIGGGQVPRPGEVSLAHNGVLFLDELPEFKPHVLEVLRQPLEDGSVTIARAASTLCFPARFMLVAAMNPCPCGYLGDRLHPCTCTPPQLQRYRARLSGPLLDRIDMHIEAPAVPVRELLDQPAGEPSSTIRKRVDRARRLQTQRFTGAQEQGIYCNAHMGNRQIKQWCELDAESTRLLHQSISRLGLSARASHRVLKIARTIADLAGEPRIRAPHLAEAIQYRRSRLGL